MKKLAHGEKPSKSELFDLYINQDMTAEELAKVYGKSKQSIKRYLMEYGISKRECKAKSKILQKYLEEATNHSLFNSEDKVITHTVKISAPAQFIRIIAKFFK